MNKEEEIREIAYRIWKKEGRTHGHDKEQWFKAETIWKKRIRNQIIFSLLYATLMGLDIFYEKWTNTFQWYHIYLIGAFFLVLLLIFWVKKVRGWLNYLITFLASKSQTVKKYASSIIFAILMTLLGIPMFAGLINFSFGNEGVSNKGNTYLNQSSLIGVALLEIALAGLLLWFIPKQTGKFGTKAVMRSSGKLLLVGASCLIIVSLLAPLIPSIKDSGYWWSIFIRYFSAICFIVGGLSLVASVISCICFAWEL
jgi:hypothetical protein